LLEEVGLAEVRANVARGDALGALRALEQAVAPPATRTQTRVKEAEGWITQLAPIAQATQVRAIAAVPQPTPAAPAWGSLAFEPTGKLLVRTTAGVVRVDVEHGDESDAGLPAWGMDVASPDGTERFVRVTDPCDGVSLHATLASGDSTTEIALPIASRLTAHCNARAIPSIPLGWGAGGLEAIIQGEPVLVSRAGASRLLAPISQVASRGSPRSPNGKTIAYPTALGILIQGPSNGHLVKGQGLDGTYQEQRDCTVADDATHVACIHAGKAWVATF
jgi:hypothetical protein